MDKDLREELIEIIRDIKTYLIYQKSLGAFVYGSDLNEEMMFELERTRKLEKIVGAVNHGRVRSENKTYTKMSLFERDEPIRETAENNKVKKAILSTEEKKNLIKDLIEEIGPDCKRCNLSNLGRSKVVFGEGDVDARIMFVGEGPGEDEDIQGLPFVGRAGQLLTRIIKAMGLERSDVYIANVVKCRPPQNRTPLPEEMDICGEFLKRQIRIIMPEIIIALGGTAASYLLRDYKIKIGQVRSRELEYNDNEITIPMVATFHPSYVLRKGESQEIKREVWKDITIAMKKIGMEVKR